MSDESNIRWADWDTVSPRQWVKIVRSPSMLRTYFVVVTLTAKDSWELRINNIYIASFNTWDEASQAAPMLFQLHKDST